MKRNEAKRLIALIWIVVFLWFSVFHLISFAPLLQDEEFDKALLRAEQIWIKDIDTIRDAPFRFLKRKEAVHRYVAMAQSADMILYDDEVCKFNDISPSDGVNKDDHDMIMLACGYRFFWWAKWWFHPDEYVTKAMSLVALMKWFYPKKVFEETEPYRDPFVNKAYDMKITSRKSNPYMMYLISKYELLLELYRAYQRKTGESL